MKYVAPFAELVSLETVSVILTSGLTGETEAVTTVPVVTGGGSMCPNETPEIEEE